MEKKDILEELARRRNKDLQYEGGRILSAVSTRPLDVTIEAYRIFSDVNALDTHVFPEAAALEAEVIEWFGQLLKNPKAAGYVATGGTEANFSALWAARKLYPKRKRIIVPESAHYSIEKAADLMGLKVEWIGLGEDFKADVSEIEERIDDRTLAVVATAGTSALGVVDPIEEIDVLCDDVFFHVDAAFGGFVLPFMETGRRMDFSLPNVDSITIDAHKMGLVPLPSGTILFREASYVEEMRSSPTYLPNKSFTLLGSRSGGAIAATWAAIKSLGVVGYKKIVGECMENTHLLCRELERIGVPPMVPPELNFVAIRPKDPQRTWSSLQKLGWNIILDSRTQSLRIVVMPHVTAKVIAEFISDLTGVI
jgi:tyrosine decarboxylase / aspartate 1-decarboxylase